MLDFAVPPDPNLALKAALLFEPYDPYWIEEPVAGDNLEALAEFRTRIRTRVTTGERQSSIHHCRFDWLSWNGRRPTSSVLGPRTLGSNSAKMSLDADALSSIAFEVAVNKKNLEFFAAEWIAANEDRVQGWLAN